MKPPTKIQVVGITLRPHKPALKPLFLKLKAKFKQHGAKVLVDEGSAMMVDYHDNSGVTSFAKMCQNSDILICCGGDGTLLNLIRKSFMYQKPILGISGGNLGFLLNVKAGDSESFIDKLFNNEFVIINKMMIALSYYIERKIYHIHAFNDIVIKSKNFENMIKIHLYINDELINTYIGDGLIIATPFGSTAYNLSAKGPIVHPLNDAIIITPICPQGFTQAPLVLPKNFVISLEIPNKDGSFIIDGQKYDYINNSKEYLSINESPHQVRLIDEVKEHYLQTLKDKLSWGI